MTSTTHTSRLFAVVFVAIFLINGCALRNAFQGGEEDASADTDTTVPDTTDATEVADADDIADTAETIEDVDDNTDQDTEEDTTTDETVDETVEETTQIEDADDTTDNTTEETTEDDTDDGGSGDDICDPRVPELPPCTGNQYCKPRIINPGEDIDDDGEKEQKLEMLCAEKTSDVEEDAFVRGENCAGQHVCEPGTKCANWSKSAKGVCDSEKDCNSSGWNSWKCSRFCDTANMDKCNAGEKCYDRPNLVVINEQEIKEKFYPNKEDFNLGLCAPR